MNSAHERDDGDFELNLAPIIDCFTVLITYLLVSASFLSLDVLNVTLDAKSDSASELSESNPRETTDLEIWVREGKSIEFKWSGAHSGQMEAQGLKDGIWDGKNVERVAQKIAGDIASIGEVRILAQDGVAYGDLILALEAVKSTFPKITLGSD